jgi:NADH-quinone oxidoreductase subunit L
MIFRTFLGDPVPEARELEHGHMAHAETPTNPLTGEAEDTDVGFPGPEHHIAERALPMRVAMGLLAVGAAVGGFLQIPQVTSVIDDFLEPAFADSRYYDTLTPSGGFAYASLVVGAIIAIAGVALAYRIWVKDPAIARRLRERFPGVHRLLVNKWYWDELLDAAFVRPGAAVGRFAQQTFERVVVNGLLVGGTTNLVRAGSAAVRSVQNGYLRYYAALLFLGLGGLGIYFLASST